MEVVGQPPDKRGSVGLAGRSQFLFSQFGCHKQVNRVPGPSVAGLRQDRPGQWLKRPPHGGILAALPGTASWRSRRDPAPQQVDLRFRERFSDRGHQGLIPGNLGQEETGGGVAGHDRRAGPATLNDRLEADQRKVRLSAVRAMACGAARLEDRLDVLAEQRSLVCECRGNQEETEEEPCRSTRRNPPLPVASGATRTVRQETQIAFILTGRRRVGTDERLGLRCRVSPYAAAEADWSPSACSAPQRSGG